MAKSDLPGCQPVEEDAPRKSVLDALRESEERYRGVVENTTAVILRLSPDGVITFANKRALEFFGYTERELIGRHALGTIVPKTETSGRDLAGMVEEIGADPDRFHSNANENICKDGRRVWIEWTNSGVYDSEGKLKEYLSVGIDATARKEAEEALGRARKQAEAILESITDAFFALDRDFRFTYVNAESERLLRKPAQELLGHCVWDIFPDADAFRKRYEQVIRTQRPDDFEEYYAPYDTWFEIHAFPSATGLAVYYRNVTDRHMAQEAVRRLNADLEHRVMTRTAELLKANEKAQAERQRFLDVLETLPIILVLLRPDRRVEWVNQAYRQSLGDNVGKYCYGSQFGLDEPCKECQAFQPLETGKPHNWQWKLPNGRTFDIYNFPFADIDGSPMILEMDIDITERVEAEAKLAGERKRLYDVMDTLPVYVILLDADHRVPFANRYFEERFGKSCGRRCHEYLFNREKPCDICETYRVMETGQPHHWYWTGPDNRDYDIYDFPFKDTDGSNLILEMGIDITEQVRAQKALKDANENLENRVAERTEALARSNKELEAFAYIASHDLQEPLRMVNQFLKLLQERYDGQLDSKAHEYIGYAADGATRMSALIRDLLEYSRIGPKEHTSTSSQRALKSALANLNKVIEETTATVEHDELPMVQADATQLMRLFQNLIANAIKFRRKGAAPRIGVSAERDNGAWHFKVKDNGIGIAPEHYERIFQIFQRLHGRSEYPGTGIGLAVCKKIVEQHDGRIWVESRTGEGSVFHFTLPE